MNPIVLVRHGHAEHIDGEMTGGWTDTALTELGRRQAAALASRLGEELRGEPVKLYCSDLRRAMETAEYVASALDVEPTPLRCLREINNGVAKDKTKAEARSHYREPTEPLLDWQIYPGAETWRQFHARVSDCMDSLAGGETPLILVTHGGTIVHVIGWWLRLDMATISSVYFDTDPASMSVLTTNRLGDRVLSRLNDTSHLLPGGLNGGRLLGPR